jgi:acetyltransferase-like isoleucine patch superfamily enzyme
MIGHNHAGAGWLLGLLGAKVGKRIFWPGSGIHIVEYDLLEVQDDVVFGSRSTFYASSMHDCQSLLTEMIAFERTRPCQTEEAVRKSISEQAFQFHAVKNNLTTSGESGIRTQTSPRVWHTIDMPLRTDADESQPIVIGQGAMVADRCVLMPGVTLGRNSVLGSGTYAPSGFQSQAGSIWLGNKSNRHPKVRYDIMERNR